MKQRKGYVWIECYKRKKMYGKRKRVAIEGYWRKVKPRKKVYIDVDKES